MAGPMNPYDAPPEPPPGGMSGTSKVLLAFGIGCGVLALLCCGVFGVTTFMAYRFAQNTILTEPDEVRQIAEQIVTIDVPASLEPEMGVDVRMPFAGTPIMKGVAFIDDDEESFLILGEANPDFGGDSGDIELQFNQAMSERGHRDRRDFKTVESEPFETTIHDEPAEFTISRLVNEESDEEYWRAEGDFQGAGGPAVLIFEGDSSDFPKDRVVDMLQSMK